MFNKSKFNRTLFNRVQSSKYTVTIESQSDITIVQRLTFKASATLSGQSTLEFVFKGAEIGGTSELSAKARQVINAGSVDIVANGKLIHTLYNITLDSNSDMQGSALVVKHYKMESNSDSSLLAACASLKHVSITIDSNGDMTVIKYHKDFLNNGVTLTGQNTTDVIGSYVITDVMILTVSFAPGEEIIIDMGVPEILKNGQNINNSMGDISEFFNLEVGTNIIQYRDTSVSRTVQATISHQDCYL